MKCNDINCLFSLLPPISSRVTGGVCRYRDEAIVIHVGYLHSPVREGRLNPAACGQAWSCVERTWNLVRCVNQGSQMIK